MATVEPNRQMSNAHSDTIHDGHDGLIIILEQLLLLLQRGTATVYRDWNFETDVQCGNAVILIMEVATRQSLALSLIAGDNGPVRRKATKLALAAVRLFYACICILE
ncbi:hypothetical protein [Candidatus Amarolinea dominans]|uniref:hypothetical protein n=1 Tax=Candidatus Amarolinea dominans TaxID=3140696 RepID=UPI0031CCA68E